jgi:hypothetical protein
MTVEELAAAKERKKAKQQERRRTRRDAGLCPCGKPPMPGHTRCVHCWELDRKRRHPPKPTRDPEALTRAVHELEEINNQRRAAGLPTLTYGQWQAARR